ncbi:hypothetical protein EDC94DRAFT_663461 [Helicostylum pulchrum]|nr:hypothetical protein EDC94DRAFT_663461 [Helicostylum pulchrum]
MSDQISLQGISSLEGRYSSMMNALTLLVDSVCNLEKLVLKNQSQDQNQDEDVHFYEDIELVERPRTTLDESGHRMKIPVAKSHIIQLTKTPFGDADGVDPEAIYKQVSKHAYYRVKKVFVDYQEFNDPIPSWGGLDVSRRKKLITLTRSMASSIGAKKLVACEDDWAKTVRFFESLYKMKDGSILLLEIFRDDVCVALFIIYVGEKGLPLN